MSVVMNWFEHTWPSFKDPHMEWLVVSQGCTLAGVDRRRLRVNRGRVLPKSISKKCMAVVTMQVRWSIPFFFPLLYFEVTPVSLTTRIRSPWRADLKRSNRTEINKISKTRFYKLSAEAKVFWGSEIEEKGRRTFNQNASKVIKRK